jgi:hypothetical protein
MPLNFKEGCFEMRSTAFSALSVGLGILLFFGCSPAGKAPSTTYGNTPQIPGGSINTNPDVLSASIFTALATGPNTVVLNWVNPAQYSTLPFKALLFREQCILKDSNCSAPSPASDGAISLFQIYSGANNTFTDTGVQPGFTYAYWLYISLNDKFSAFQSLAVTPTPGKSALTTLSATNFWPNETMTVGQSHTGAGPFFPSANFLAASKVSEGSLAGGMATASDGSILYYADTVNNRVVIMVKQIAYQCHQANTNSPSQLQACLTQSTGEPFVPMNVIGQPSRVTSLSCQDRVLSCAATASNVSVTTSAPDANGNTVSKYNVTDPATSQTLATFQTQPEALASACSNASFCSWQGSDAGHVCSVNADQCMTGPSSVAVDGTKLLVSDSGNNRVLIYDALPTQYSACDASIGSDVIVTKNCSANDVIGKKSVNDLTDYSLPGRANSESVILNLPSGTATVRISEAGAYAFGLASIKLSAATTGQALTATSSPIAIPSAGSIEIGAPLSSKTLNADLLTETITGASTSVQYWGNLKPGAYIDFTVQAPAAGPYRLALNYSAASSFAQADIYVASSLQTTISLPASGGGIVTDGNRILSSPGALLVKDGNLFIADRGNNRVVRISSYQSPDAFKCSTTETQVSGGTAFGDWNPICLFDHVFGQETLFQSQSFVQIVLDAAAHGIDVISSSGAGNFLTPSYLKSLKRYFGSPTALAFSDSGQLLVAADQNFSLESGDINTLAKSNPRYSNWYLERISLSPIALKSRIMVFEPDQVLPLQPTCQPAVFGSGGCDASAIIGQLDSQTIPIFSGSTAADYKNSISYGLTYVTSFIVSGASMIAVDSVTNDLYFWNDWTNDIQGRPFDFRITNPLGQAYPSNANRAMPNLKSISSILYAPLTETFTVSDPGAGQIYEIRKPK